MIQVKTSVKYRDTPAFYFGIVNFFVAVPLASMTTQLFEAQFSKNDIQWISSSLELRKSDLCTRFLENFERDLNERSDWSVYFEWLRIHTNDLRKLASSHRSREKLNMASIFKSFEMTGAIPTELVEASLYERNMPLT